MGDLKLPWSQQSTNQIWQHTSEKRTTSNYPPMVCKSRSMRLVIFTWDGGHDYSWCSSSVYAAYSLTVLVIEGCESRGTSPFYHFFLLWCTRQLCITISWSRPESVSSIRFDNTERERRSILNPEIVYLNEKCKKLMKCLPRTSKSFGLSIESAMCQSWHRETLKISFFQAAHEC